MLDSQVCVIQIKTISKKLNIKQKLIDFVEDLTGHFDREK